MDHGDNELDRNQDEAVLNFDIDDAAIELAATGVGTIPTASVWCRQIAAFRASADPATPSPIDQ
jgi:hypothetical protein